MNERGQLQIPNTARKVKVAQVLPRVALVFEDDQGKVVHCEVVELQPIYEPFGAELEQSIHTAVDPMQESLAQLGQSDTSSTPAKKPRR